MENKLFEETAVVHYGVVPTLAVRVEEPRVQKAAWVGAGFLVGAGLGAAAMYFLDPRLGHRRQVLVRDQLVHLNKQAIRYSRLGLQLARDRVKGAGAGLVGALRPERYLDDDKLLRRVRSQVGRALRRPHDFQITAQNGIITLLSSDPSENFDQIIPKIQRVKGVRNVEFLPIA